MEKEQILHYKFEDEHFYKSSDFSLFWKIPYEAKFSDYKENSQEPQYFNIVFLKADSFLKVISNLVSFNN